MTSEDIKHQLIIITSDSENILVTILVDWNTPTSDNENIYVLKHTSHLHWKHLCQ